MIFLKKDLLRAFFIRDSLFLLRVFLYGILCFRKLTGPHQRCIQNHAKHLRQGLFQKYLMGFRLFTILAKSSFLDVSQGSEYVFV